MLRSSVCASVCAHSGMCVHSHGPTHMYVSARDAIPWVLHSLPFQTQSITDPELRLVGCPAYPGTYLSSSPQHSPPSLSLVSRTQILIPAEQLFSSCAVFRVPSWNLFFAWFLPVLCNVEGLLSVCILPGVSVVTGLVGCGAGGVRSVRSQ